MSTNIRPATTGDTANGKSISAMRKVRPGNLNRDIAHAAATPKTMFATSAIGTVVRVRMIE